MKEHCPLMHWPTPTRNKNHRHVQKSLVGEGWWNLILIEVTHDRHRGNQSCSNCAAERSSVAGTLPAADSPGPARRGKAAQGELHAQLLLALRSPSASKGEKSGSHPVSKAGTSHSGLTYIHSYHYQYKQLNENQNLKHMHLVLILSN